MMNNVKLSILIYSLAGGGAERVVSYLLEYCLKNNIKVHLILMNTTINYDIPKNIPIHYLEKSNANESGFKKALKIPFLAIKYAGILKKLQITHSLSFLTRPSFINILSAKFTNHKYKIISNERAFPSLQYSYKGFQSTFNKKMINWLYKKSNMVISNSYGNGNDLTSNFSVPKEKMKVVHNPVNLDKVKSIQAINNFFDTKFFNIVTVGRLDEGKNHTLLINAIHKKDDPAIRLYIFGAGILLNKLNNLIMELGLEKQVFLMGFDPNPYKYLKKADLFIFGSNHEGFPNVLLEAMACGLPILTTNCQSGPNEIMDLKKEENDIMITDYGILVPIKNLELMVKGINHFISNSEYLENCRAKVKQRVALFEKDKILSKYLELIKSA